MKNFTFSAILFGMVLSFLSVNLNAQLGVQDIKIGVVADIHLFDSTLIINDGPAFQQYLAYDRKLLKESHAIARSVIDSLKTLNLDILLVAGDLTKDGEYLSMQTLAAMFQELENAGTEVVVVPGNHDVNNPHAVSFDGASMTPVQGTTPAQFRSLFQSHGFGQATILDTASLSYVVEPIAGLQILALDVCHYDSNYSIGHPETAGGFKPQVLQWALDRIDYAKNHGKVIIGIEHHNLLEHYLGQKSMFSEYIIEDWDTISSQLANAGLKVMFTGHYHAQDIIAKTTSTGSQIFDVETGSLVTYPCPYRVMTLDTDTNLIIDGKRVTVIDFNTNGLPFQTYARNYIESGLPILVNYILTSPPYSLDSVTASMVVPAVTETFIAHYEGNEGTPTPQTQAVIQMLKVHPTQYAMGYALEGIWNDATPDDWTVTIDLGYSNSSVGYSQSLNTNSILLFPNPSTGIFNLITPFEKHDIFVQVVDAQGREVKSMNTENQQNTVIDLSHLPKGAYMIVLSGNGMKLSKKIVLK
ncbi:MAG: T9SS type A sorting domain-containing protein [Bacteroidales bacterium]|nr:T9SS type A sorting domain-containing protein [Bacteroidales bacterium]